jgi:hypothetical protein
MPRKAQLKLQPLSILLEELEAIEGLPPDFDDLTLDQTKLWHGVKRMMGLISAKLRAYYTGAAPPSLIGLPAHHRKMIDALVNYYIKFHALCFWYWSEIDHARKAQGLYANTQSPGDALYRLTEIECFAMMMRSEQRYNRYSIAKKRAVFELSRKIINQGERVDSALLEELRQLERSDEWLKPYFNFRDSIWNFCFNQKRPSSEQTQALRGCLKRFRMGKKAHSV